MMRQWRFTFLVTIAIVVCLSMFRLAMRITESTLQFKNVWSKQRARQSIEAIAKIDSSNSILTLFLGASEIELGFVPNEFDESASQTNSRLVSYNLGVRNVGSIFPIYLERIKSEIINHKIHVPVILVNLPPSRLTYKANNSTWEQNNAYDLATVYFNFSIWNNISLSFAEKAQLAFDKYVLGERKASLLNTYLAEKTRGVLRYKDRSFQPMVDLWRGDAFYSDVAWNPETRGHFFFDIENNAEALKGPLDYLRTNEGFEMSIKVNESCCDFVNLDIKSDYVAEAAKHIRELKSVADAVILVHIPENPRFKRSPELKDKPRRIVSQLAELAQVPFWAVEDLEPFVEDDFVDVIHLSLQGAKKFSRLLATQVVQSVGKKLHEVGPNADGYHLQQLPKSTAGHKGESKKTKNRE